MQCNKASGCRGGQRGFGEEAMRLLMEQRKKKTKRFGRVEGMNLLPWRSTYTVGDVSGGEVVRSGGERERNQTGWTARAHTDALCLMSR